MTATVDFNAHLARQLAFITTSCARFDAGDVDEAIRIAVALRVIFHDAGGRSRKSSVSLLSHLQAGPRLQLLSTADNVRKSAGLGLNLCDAELAPAQSWARFVPKLETARRQELVTKREWWKKETIFAALNKGDKVSRRDLTLMAANQDGGAHVDAQLEARYRELVDGHGWMITTHVNGVSTDIPFRNAHLSALRQMAYEVLNSPALITLSAPATLPGVR